MDNWVVFFPSFLPFFINVNPLFLDLIEELWNFQELEALADPMRKEVSLVRKKIDAVNKELKPLGHTCQKKVDIYLFTIFF